MMNNPIITLSELVQREYGESILTEILGKSGQDHCPVVKVRITLPNGVYRDATGCNKRVAKQKAAQELLAYLNE